MALLGSTSPAGVTLRPACEADQPAIRALVHSEGLDPTGLRWQHFTVAEASGEIVGVGQIRPHPHCRELGSLVIQPAWRQQGLGAALVQAILAAERSDVYLECPVWMVAYYTRFGFATIRLRQTPMPLKLKAAVGKLLMRLTNDRLVVMARRAS